ncbi:LytTR family transcriptional regulator DNA-binding domain-containing protein [Intrasporangium calvum]|uniref:LytTR family transcriptional regulator DNA-binding domain-containing protein n=1 Tax=Intrasporangium calvum TaxID=53358 RepID=A0ABT5GMH1_9MICO|nr:DNA-binding protein [Intrasporangium calvum]MDC5699090.1 LytTR family transcriptional regulator DNA-binding domain-containing protein [Intrasporangium calvum]
MSLTLSRSEAAAVSRARECFRAGFDSLSGVRPAIASSWLRCRDTFAVDPQLCLAPRASNSTWPGLEDEVLLVQLGGQAAAAQPRLPEAVVTVVDADGRLVGAWGDGVPGAAEANLSPCHLWSESATGTNGMGTALRSHRLTAIRGPEHWCDGFQGLDCLAAPIVDPVTKVALAAVNISTATGAMPERAPELLRSMVSSTHARLDERARDRRRDLAAAFTQFASRSRNARLALDAGGGVVATNGPADQLLGVTGPEGGDHRRARPGLEVPDLADVFAAAVATAHGAPEPAVTARLLVPGREEWVEALFTPVLSAGSPIGFLVSVGSDDGTPLRGTSDQPSGPDRAQGAPVEGSRSRIVAQRGNRTVLLRPADIHSAEAQGNTVWLTTEHGRLRAADRGLKNVEEVLVPHGFLRVHRSHLVDPNRVREVGRARGGELLLFLDLPGSSAIPVSRRQASLVRAALGL